MTREEAIENLNMISVAFVEPVTKEQRKLIDDTFEMAIKALEQVTKVRKLILQAERAGVHLDYGAYKFMNALEKVVGEKQIGEFI